MEAADLTCLDLRARRDRLRAADFNGVDFVEVDEDGAGNPVVPPVLCVHFFGDIPQGLTAANVRIEGGRRIRDIRVTGIQKRRSEDPEIDDCLQVALDRAGDLTTYRLCLVDADGAAPLVRIDRRYRCADFVFRVDCTGCAPAPACPPPDPGPAPEINYVARDYYSFRQLLLDRLAVLVPDWRERHEADLGITLLEVLAYVGDSLSYFQDAVATEAYLATARQRISVRRHARLVGYAMHEGCNARAFLSLTTDTDLTLPAGDVLFTTGLDASACSPEGRIRAIDELAGAAPGSFEVFEPVASPVGGIPVVAAHSEIEIYTWGDSECCLPAGATRATLRDGVDGTGQRLLRGLRDGSLLLFEEVVSPETGDPADADPLHRHVVRLTSAAADVDPVFEQPIVEIQWAAADALPFPLCLSASTGAPDCRVLTRLVVARGNVIVVDHGATVVPDEPLGEVGVDSSEGECRCDGAQVEITERPARFRPVLARQPLTFRQSTLPDGAAAHLLVQDPRQALPAAELTSSVPGEPAATWTPRLHLLDSGPGDDHFTVEVDNQGRAHLRFGDGELGRQPPARSSFTARYRTGNGPAGNVGRDTITDIVLRTTSISGVLLQARNPLPAAGGTAPESIAEVVQLAPGAFRRILRRAITADDYAALAQAPDGIPSALIQGAAAELQWTGSWYEAHVAVDPLGSSSAPPELLAAIEAGLARFRRVRHDLRAAAARYVPLDVELSVCVLPPYVRRDVVAALLGVLGSARLPEGRLGLFHPDNLRLGQGVFLSRMVAAAQLVPGVQSVAVDVFKRLFAPERGEKESGVLRVSFSEIAQLDNDPNLPENGRLLIHARGGR